MEENENENEKEETKPNYPRKPILLLLGQDQNEFSLRRERCQRATNIPSTEESRGAQNNISGKEKQKNENNQTKTQLKRGGGNFE